MNIKYFTWVVIRDGVCEGGLSGCSLSWGRFFGGMVFREGGVMGEWSFVRVVSWGRGLSWRWCPRGVVFREGGVIGEWSFVRVVSWGSGLSWGWWHEGAVFREGGVLGARSLVSVVCCGCLSGTSFGTGGYVNLLRCVTVTSVSFAGRPVENRGRKWRHSHRAVCIVDYSAGIALL